MITSMQGSYSIKELCEALGVSRSGYHAACARGPAPRAQANAPLLGRMQAIHCHRHTRSYGSPRLARELQDTDSPCSVNRVAHVTRAVDLHDVTHTHQVFLGSAFHTLPTRGIYPA